MSRRPEHSKGWFPRLRHVSWVTLVATGLVLGSASVAAAYWSLDNTGPGAARAGHIAPPTTFSATSSFPNVATLSWKAPSTPSPTGYMLTQSTGTLAGTCTAITGTSTSCTATGLTQGTTYTWHLVAKDHTWSSTQVTASATTVTPSITLAPTSGPDGTVVQVTGTHFAATSGLTFTFTPTGGTATTLTPTNCTPTSTTAGALPATPCEITIPAAAATGSGTVTVTDANNNTATATFTVTADTGLGTMTVTPTTAIQSATGKTFTFTFTAPTTGMTHGTVTLTIATGWTAPSTTKHSAGYVTLTPNSAGTLTITGRTIKVTAVTLGAGQTFAIIYGTGGGTTGVTVTSTLGTSTFTTKEASTSAGTPTTIFVQPTVDVIPACTPITGTHSLAPGATTHFVLVGASGATGGGTGGTGAGGTKVSGTLKNNGASTVTIHYILGCEGVAGDVTSGGTGGAGYANGGTGGTGHSAQAGGGGGGGGASALEVGNTVLVVAGGGGGGGGRNTSNTKGDGPASPSKEIAATSAQATGLNGTPPTNDSQGGTGGGGGGGGATTSARGGTTGLGGTGGTSYGATATSLVITTLSVTLGTSGAPSSETFTP